MLLPDPRLLLLCGTRMRRGRAAGGAARPERPTGVCSLTVCLPRDVRPRWTIFLGELPRCGVQGEVMLVAALLAAVPKAEGLLSQAMQLVLGVVAPTQPLAQTQPPRDPEHRPGIYSVVYGPQQRRRRGVPSNIADTEPQMAKHRRELRGPTSSGRSSRPSPFTARREGVAWQ